MTIHPASARVVPAALTSTPNHEYPLIDRPFTRHHALTAQFALRPCVLLRAAAGGSINKVDKVVRHAGCARLER